MSFMPEENRWLLKPRRSTLMAITSAKWQQHLPHHTIGNNISQRKPSGNNIIHIKVKWQSISHYLALTSAKEQTMAVTSAIKPIIID